MNKVVRSGNIKRLKLEPIRISKVLIMKFFLPLLLLAYSITLFSQPNHNLWTEVLKAHVSSEGNVNYLELQKNPEQLNQYISLLQNDPPKETWSNSQKLAYWINAYNTLTIDLILKHYPVKSIKDIKKPWNQELWNFSDKWLSLNDIEHKILRKLDEPRIHFAIVCASVSCPKLHNEAFTGNKLDAQLDKATKTFLNDPSKNTIAKERLELSKIFKWFSKDFKSHGGVVNFIDTHTSFDISSKAKITYLDYNWDLNE